MIELENHHFLISSEILILTIITDAKTIGLRIADIACTCFVPKNCSVDYLFTMDEDSFHYFTSAINLTQPHMTYLLMSFNTKLVAPLKYFYKKYLT